MTTIIGIAGTAKNTGKTTTTFAIMEKLYSEGITLGLTSIGYDGEVLDNITGLPKPRIKCRQGTILAVAEKCLEFNSTRVKILEKTSIITPLGKIIIGEVLEDGLVAIAGPNKSREVKLVNKLFEKYKCQLVIVDGALNRIAPMVETHGVILATGAARNSQINQLTLETHCIDKIFALKKYESIDEPKYISQSILNKDMVVELLSKMPRDTKVLQIEGIFGEKSFHDFIQLARERIRGLTIVFPDAIKILVAGNPLTMHNYINAIEDLGGKINVIKKINLIALTLNPFYPRFRFDSKDYRPDFVDAKLLLKSISEKVNVPAFDIVQNGAEELWQEIKRIDFCKK